MLDGSSTYLGFYIAHFILLNKGLTNVNKRMNLFPRVVLPFSGRLWLITCLWSSKAAKMCFFHEKNLFKTFFLDDAKQDGLAAVLRQREHGRRADLIKLIFVVTDGGWK
jgi:hypothetical protein